MGDLGSSCLCLPSLPAPLRQFLNDVTGIKGLMARSAVVTGTPHQNGAWHKSTAYPGWTWKGDTSSDEVRSRLWLSGCGRVGMEELILVHWCVYLVTGDRSHVCLPNLLVDRHQCHVQEGSRVSNTLLCTTRRGSSTVDADNDSTPTGL